MKKTTLLLILTILAQIVSSQSADKIAGVYHLQSGSHDPQGGVNLIITPQNQYFIAYFGGIQYGTWKEFEGNLIMQPDTTARDAFYVSGYNNPEIPKDSIYIAASGMSDSPVLCSFGTKGQDPTMHPVYNKYPNCFGRDNIALPKGKYNEFSLMSAPDIFDEIEYQQDEVKWQNVLANFLKSKNRTIQDTDTITGIKYTFPLSSSYNEYRISYNATGDRFIPPILGVFQGTKLRIGNDSYRKSADIDSLNDEDKAFFKRFSSTVSPYPSIGSIEGDDYERSSPQSQYKPVKHTNKERKQVNYDLNNILTVTCYEYHNNQ